jgi:hypothetical protein
MEGDVIAGTVSSKTSTQERPQTAYAPLPYEDYLVGHSWGPVTIHQAPSPVSIEGKSPSPAM